MQKANFLNKTIFAGRVIKMIGILKQMQIVIQPYFHHLLPYKKSISPRIKIIFTVLTVILSVNIVFGQPHKQRKDKDIKEELISRIDRLEIEFSKNMDRRQKEEFKKRIYEIIAIIDRSEISESFIYPINDRQFEQLSSQIKNTSFDNQKRDIIQSAAQNNFFITDQLVSILQLFNFDKEKMEVLKIVYPRVLDPENNFKLYACFNLYKDELTKYLRGLEANRSYEDNKVPSNDRPNPKPRYDKHKIVPVSDYNLSQIIQGYKNTTFESDRLQYIRTVASSNYFLINQIIELVNSTSYASEDTKLSVIEILYPNITDTNNNFLLYDCFTFSSSKEKLGQFIQKFEAEN
jgi:hypothetical protein